MCIRLRTLLMICQLTGLITLFSSCNQTSGAADEEPSVITPVTITPVEVKTVTSTIDLPATTTFMNKSIIRANTTGTIEKIMVAPGEYIHSKQLLFTIRTREAMALNDLMGNDSSLTFKGLINIFSPKEGVISSVSYQKGDFVQEGDELAVMSEQSSLVFILDVPYEFETIIEKNRNCTITFPDNKKINGTITGRLSEMNAETQTIRYIVKPSSVGRLPANLIATVTLIKSISEKALVLPKKAILGDETQTQFWVMKLINDSTAVKVIVKKGLEYNGEVEIKDPVFLLSDRIILTGNYGLPDTARISIIRE
jgi:biotin carboxyl carrier protein